ncbi:transposase [Caballeronia sp. INSB1]|uniref:transposase n=1 Tax=Caballeronia sp. INSB1 TaxID=2921751 RepID=UPI003904A53C
MVAPLRTCESVVYAKRPFAGPKAVLGHLSHQTHRVAISNQRLIAFDGRGVTSRPSLIFFPIAFINCISI